MAGSKSHDDTARKLAKKFGAEYNKGPGADIKAKKLAVEIETENTINDASRQLQGYKKPVYVAPTTNSGVEKALKKYKDTTIGVMDKTGKIIKKSKRK